MSSDTTKKCGYCNGTFSKKELQAPLQFRKNCKICNISYRIRSSCANEMLKGANKNKKGKQMNVIDFNNSMIPLYCSKCKQKNCFYCDKIHTGKFKYII
jgi:hypothetical protein